MATLHEIATEAIEPAACVEFARLEPEPIPTIPAAVDAAWLRRGGR